MRENRALSLWCYLLSCREQKKLFLMVMEDGEMQLLMGGVLVT